MAKSGHMKQTLLANFGDVPDFEKLRFYNRMMLRSRELKRQAKPYQRNHALYEYIGVQNDS